MRGAIIATLLAVAACTVNTGPYGAGFLCSDGVCPSGLDCVQGICRAPGGADAGNLDAPGEDGGTGRVCGGSAGLVEDFSDGLLADWWIDPGTNSVFAYDDALVLTIPAGPGSSSAFSSPRLDLVESHWFARVLPAPGSADTFFGIQSGLAGGDFLRIRHLAGTLSFGTDEANVEVAYDPAMHAFWGFRERAGQLHFETSPDGIGFTSHHVIPSTDFVDRFQAVMSVGRGADEPEASAVFDDFNVSSAAPTPFCPAAERSDDFEDGVIAETWSQFGNGCTDVTEVDGELIIRTPAGTSCVLVTAGLRDLSESVFELELATFSPAAFLSYSVFGEFGRFQLDSSAGQLRLFDCPLDACTLVAELPFVDQMVWRFRGTGSTVVFELSSNGQDFVALAESISFDPRASRASLIIGSSQEVHLARFN